VVLGGFVKGWGGEFTPTSFSQSIWRELATKIRFEVSLTAVFNPSRHTFYPSPEQQFWFDTKNNSLWTFEFATNWHHLKLCINQCVLIIPAVSCVYFVCQCPAKLFCWTTTTQSWFSSEKRWVESFQSNVDHFAPLVSWHNYLDNVYKPTVCFCLENRKTLKPEN
jgi:hypothetical protein